MGAEGMWTYSLTDAEREQLKQACGADWRHQATLMIVRRLLVLLERNSHEPDRSNQPKDQTT